MMKKRQFWLDNLKAFCILAVIATHVNSFVFHNGGSFIAEVIDTFFMGGFFIVSGYLGNKSFCEPVSLKKFVDFKTYNILIPYFVTGSLFVMVSDLVAGKSISHNPLLYMLSNGDNFGYWFLMTLFIFKFTSHIIGFISCYINWRYFSNLPYFRFLLQSVLFCGVCLLFLLLIKMLFNIDVYNCYNAHILFYFPFYILGVFVHQFGIVEKIKSFDSIMAVSFFGGVILCVYYHFVEMGHPIIWMTTYRVLIVVSLFLYFYKYLNVEFKWFTNCGVHSLELYIFHFFFFIGCLEYNSDFIIQIKNMPFLFQLLFVAIMTFVVSSFTMGVSWFVNNNKILKLVFLGKK